MIFWWWSTVQRRFWVIFWNKQRITWWLKVIFRVGRWLWVGRCCLFCRTQLTLWKGSTRFSGPLSPLTIFTSSVPTHQCTTSCCWGRHWGTWFLLFLNLTLGITVIFPSWACCFPSEVFQLLSEECLRSFLASEKLTQSDGLIWSDFVIGQSLSAGFHLTFGILRKSVSTLNFNFPQLKAFLWVRSFSFSLFPKLISENKVGFRHGFWLT